MVTISGETAEELRNNILALARTYEGGVPTLQKWIDDTPQENTDVEQIEAPVEEPQEEAEEAPKEEPSKEFPTDAICIHCEVPLKVPDNWYPSKAKLDYRCCKHCFNDGSKAGRKAGDKDETRGTKRKYSSRKESTVEGEQPTCSKCDVVLNEENWYPSQRTRRIYQCKNCQKAANREYRQRRRNLAEKAEERWGRPQSTTTTTKAEEPVQSGQPVFNAEATYGNVMDALKDGGTFQSTPDMAFISSVNVMLQRFADWSPTDFVYAENGEGGATLIWMTMDGCPSLAEISISDF